MYIAKRLFDFKIDSQNRYMSDISNLNPLSLEEERKLFDEYHNNKDENARKKLILHNLKFVVSVAKQYANNKNIMLGDLINEGNIGLMRAIETYDYKKYNTRFISYAVYWIQRQIFLYLYSVSPIVKHNIELYKLSLKFKDIIANSSDIEEAYEKIRAYIEKTGKKIDDIDRFMSLYRDYVLFSMVIGDEDSGLTVEDMLSSTLVNDKNMIDEISNNLLIENVLNSLCEVEKEFICHYYGICGYKHLSPKQLAEKYGVNIYTITKIHAKIINNIKYRNYLPLK